MGKSSTTVYVGLDVHKDSRSSTPRAHHLDPNQTSDSPMGLP